MQCLEKQLQIKPVADTGVAMVQLQLPLKERAPNQRQLVVQRAKITLKYVYCVGLGAALC